MSVQVMVGPDLFYLYSECYGLNLVYTKDCQHHWHQKQAMQTVQWDILYMAILYQYGYTKYTIKSIAALITTQLHVVTALIYNKIIAMPG